MAGVMNQAKGASWVAAAILFCLLLFSAEDAGAAQGKNGRPDRPKISTEPALYPGFTFKKRDYVVRCEDSAIEASMSIPVRWKARVEGMKVEALSIGKKENLDTGRVKKLPRGVSGEVSMTGGSGFHFVVRRKGSVKKRVFHVRCLPGDFPGYRFVRKRPGGPRLMFVQMPNRYATILDRNGVPVWWYKASGVPDNASLLDDGTVAWAPVAEAYFQQGDYEIRTLGGHFIRTVKAAGGLSTDVHELLVLPNGNYLTGAFRDASGVNTKPFGGGPEADVRGAEIQELRPDGTLAWGWRSEDHIGLAETGRWWEHASNVTNPYDLVHWNSVERNGDSLLMSFRHLDAVYKIDRASGEVVWKLGGTETGRSLRVLGDPQGDYPFGGQHDIRQDRNGTITIFDNNTEFDRAPRVLRYRIDEKAGTAMLIKSFGDPKVPVSVCCGSARRLGSGDWLVGWGGNGTTGLVGSYDSKGRPVFRLWTPGGFSYRAHPIDGGFPSLKRLRRGMDSILANR